MCLRAIVTQRKRKGGNLMKELLNLVKNGVDAIVEEFGDESSRAFESDSILCLLQGARHLIQTLANLI